MPKGGAREICSVEGCGKPCKGWGLCVNHYHKMRWDNRSPDQIAEHRQRQREYNRKYRETHKERLREANRLYWVTHPDYRESKRRWVDTHPVERQEACRKWRLAHPLERRAASAKRRALKRSAFIGPVDYQSIIERDNWICGICGKKIKAEELSFDHILPLSQGGADTQANIQVSHRHCNSRKGKGWISSQMRLPYEVEA